jgi:hypothetical protein
MGILNTFKGGFEDMRNSDVTADETPIDGSASGYSYCFSDKPSHAKELGLEFNGAQIFFSSGKSFAQGTGDASMVADKSCHFKLYGWPSNGPCMEICEGTISFGENRIWPVAEGHDLTEAVGCWSIELDSTAKHPSLITVANNDDTQGLANLTLDTVGLNHIAVIFDDVSTPCNAHIRPY